MPGDQARFALSKFGESVAETVVVRAISILGLAVAVIGLVKWLFLG
jgi:hypothetical protein